MGDELFTNTAKGNTVDYMLRTAQQNHLLLSAMADRKANILIGASFIMLTLIIGEVETHGFTLPLSILGAFTLTASVFAVFVVVPSPEILRVAEDDNLMFFGSIANHEQDDYARKLSGMMQSTPKIYAAIAQDLWEHAVLLKRRKYRYLRISYMTFLWGWVATILSAIVTLALG